MKSESILLVEDDRGLRDLLRDELESDGYRVIATGSAEEARNVLVAEIPDLVISDIRLPGDEGLSLLPVIKALAPVPAILFITAFGTVRQAVEALKEGADNFITKPLDMDYLLVTVGKLLANRRLRDEVARYRQLLAGSSFHGMIASSPAMTNLFDQVRRIGAADGPVHITGESGTGKELVARALHEESARSGGPYLTVNCGGIPGELLESEFFGHSAGAFTGARNRRLGFFQQADGGTLLLDEIGEMPMSLQAKLLRVLQGGEVRPVGDDRALNVDVRIIAATNRNLSEAVEQGQFREDLFFRLETFLLDVPPLRSRGEDVPLLANHFLAAIAGQRKITVRGFSDAAMAKLRNYTFPGNVRELHNAVERAVTFCDGEVIEPGHLPERMRGPAGMAPARQEGDAFTWQADNEALESLAVVQRRYVEFVLGQTGGNKRRAAAILGITRRTLYRWLEDA